ncbi:MAG: competence protein ComK [Bacilli bacterium]|jgi:competence protein ComK
MSFYEINEETLAILPIDNYRSKIVEKEKELVVNQTPYEIIDNSCQYFGSSFAGRKVGTKKLIGVTHKAPIIIEESKEIIFFPTTSPLVYECCWISLGNIEKYYKGIDKSIILFNTGYKLELDISYGSLDNQILRAARLESVLRKRKELRDYLYIYK